MDGKEHPSEWRNVLSYTDSDVGGRQQQPRRAYRHAVAALPHHALGVEGGPLPYPPLPTNLESSCRQRFNCGAEEEATITELCGPR